jgi:hypothetical protein
MIGLGHMSIFLKVKHRYSGSEKYIKALIAELCMDTFVISTFLLYFFKNPSSWMLFINEISFFKSFPEQLTFLIGSNLQSFSLRQSPSNNYRDLEFNPYSTFSAPILGSVGIRHLVTNAGIKKMGLRVIARKFNSPIALKNFIFA